jgi:hypothetical protein
VSATQKNYGRLPAFFPHTDWKDRTSLKSILGRQTLPVTGGRLSCLDEKQFFYPIKWRAGWLVRFFNKIVCCCVAASCAEKELGFTQKSISECEYIIRIFNYRNVLTMSLLQR